MQAITEGLADAILEAHRGQLPSPVTDAAERSLLNAIAVTIAGSQHPAVAAIIEVGAAHGGTGVHLVPGRDERLDPLTAATAIGTAAHLDDFDDTHLRTVIHPGAASLAAVWTVGHRTAASGEEVLRAFALGIEAQLRVGNAISPWHYDDGWHITGTCGPIGASIAAGLLLGLDAAGLRQAVGLAASQTLGIREAFGTMMKPFHAGKAAANGVLAALLVEEGFTASHRVLEAPRGFFAVVSPNGSDPQRVLDGFGTSWEIEDNMPKPYPCGIVSHPAIDAAIVLAGRLPAHDPVRRVVARVHPLVVELTGNPRPVNGLQARFSTAHGIAVGLLDGEAGLAQFEDVRVGAEDVDALRALVQFEVDESCPRDAATLRIELGSGRQLEMDVEHARGSRHRPLRAEELREKATRLIEPVLGGGAATVFDALDTIGVAADLEALAAACTPASVRT